MRVKFSEVQTGTAAVQMTPPASAREVQVYVAPPEAANAREIQVVPGQFVPAVPAIPPVGVPPPDAPSGPMRPPVGSQCFSCGQAFKIDIYDGDFCPVCGVDLNAKPAGMSSAARVKRELAKTAAKEMKKSDARARGPGGAAVPPTVPAPATVPDPAIVPPATIPGPVFVPPISPGPAFVPPVPPEPPSLAPPSSPESVSGKVAAASPVAIHSPGPSVVVLPGARPANTSQAVVVVPDKSKAVVLYDPSTWLDENAVPISLEDVYMPRLNIVQKVGDMSLVHVQGSVVLNQVLAVYVPGQSMPDGKGGLASVPPTAPVRIVLTCFRPMQYVEKVPEATHRGELFNTVDEVLAFGGTLDYAEAQSDPNKTLFQKMATALVIIQKPEFVTDLESFPYEYAGTRWAPALWSMKGTAFTHAYKNMATCKRHGPLSGRKWYERAWLLSTQLKKFNTNFAYVPVVKLDVETGPGFLDLITKILSQPRMESENAGAEDA